MEPLTANEKEVYGMNTPRPDCRFIYNHSNQVDYRIDECGLLPEDALQVVMEAGFTVKEATEYLRLLPVEHGGNW